MNIANYLDPRYKELPFLDVTSKSRMIDQVEDKLLGLEREVQGAGEEATSHEETNELSPKKCKDTVSKLLGDLFEELNMIILWTVWQRSSKCTRLKNRLILNPTL